MKLYDVTNPFILAIKEAVKMTYSLNIHTSLRYLEIKTTEQEVQVIKEILSQTLILNTYF